VKGGKVVKVYDGDTITIATYFHDKVYRFSVRLNGIDSPEIKGPNKADAVISRDALSALVMNKVVVLKNVKTEKYGRLLADVYMNGVNVSDWMLKAGHAVPYSGGTKKS
jgi:micrococcal nuclease